MKRTTKFSAKLITLPILIRVLLITAAALALFSLTLNYATTLTQPFKGTVKPVYESVRGYELTTPFVAIALQLIVSGLLIFLIAKLWVRIVVLIIACLQLGVALVYVRFDMASRWFLSIISQTLGWGYWLLLIASILTLACCILSFFVKQPQRMNHDLLDQNL